LSGFFIQRDRIVLCQDEKDNPKQGFLQAITNRGKIESLFRCDVGVVFFACTGFTFFTKIHLIFSVWEKRPFVTPPYYFSYFRFNSNLLLIYGFIFGQFSIFPWKRKSRFFRRIAQVLSKKIK